MTIPDILAALWGLGIVVAVWGFARHGARWRARRRYCEHLRAEPATTLPTQAWADARELDERFRMGMKLMLVGVGAVRAALLLQQPPPVIVDLDWVAAGGYWATLLWLTLWTHVSDRARARWAREMPDPPPGPPP